MKDKKLLIYLIIILLFSIIPFIEWKLEIGMTFDEFINVIRNSSFVNQWKYLTYANSKIFILIYPIIIIYFSIKQFFDIYHSGMLYSISERVDYKSYLNKSFLKIYLNNSWVYCAFIFFMLIICFILFKHDISSLQLIGYGNIHYLLFASISGILSILFSIFILNIGLISTRYCKKFSICLIVSYMSFIAYAIVSEILIGTIVNSFIKLDGAYNSFSLFNMIILDGNVFMIFIYSIILLLVSTYIVYKIYIKKDEVLMSYE